MSELPPNFMHAADYPSDPGVLASMIAPPGSPIQTALKPGLGVPIQTGLRPGIGSPIQTGLSPSAGAAIQTGLSPGIGAATGTQELPPAPTVSPSVSPSIASRIGSALSDIVQAQPLEAFNQAAIIGATAGGAPNMVQGAEKSAARAVGLGGLFGSTSITWAGWGLIILGALLILHAVTAASGTQHAIISGVKSAVKTGAETLAVAG